MVQGRKINDDELVEISGGVDDLKDLQDLGPKSKNSFKPDSKGDADSIPGGGIDPETENPGSGNQQMS